MEPPKPKPDPPEGLAEVERALSVLHGRHPEHERARREDLARRAERKAQLDAASAVEALRLRRRRALVAVAAAAVVLVVLVLALFSKRALDKRARLEAAAEPFLALGFTSIDNGEVEPGCFVAAAANAGRVKLALGPTSVEGVSPVYACTCEGATAIVDRDRVALLRADAATFGGSRAAAFLPFRPGHVADLDGACAEASLEAWIASGRWEKTESAVRPVLAPREPRAGFDVRVIDHRAPFALMTVPDATCLLAVSSGADRVGLRLGATSVSKASSVGFCAATGGLATFEREGAADVEVLLVPAERAGGLVGLRELAARAGIAPASLVVPPGDHGWDAKALLVASAFPESLVAIANAPEIPVDPEARVVALSLDRPLGLASDAADGVYSFCDAPLDRATSALCVFSGANRWHGTSGGLARAKLPFWLFGLQRAVDPAALKVEAELVALARQLRRDGFEPTTIEAVTETEAGAEVLGRADEDGVVVLALAPVSPWAFPCSDGPVWKLGGPPHVVPLAPLQRREVKAQGKLPPRTLRRTVVFRHRRRAAP